MRYLGLLNTFMAAPFDDSAAVTIATPANSRSDISTNPGRHLQTTPLDLGLLLEMIYQCGQGGGQLMVVFPGAFAGGECSEMMTVMSQNQIDSLIEVGVPPGTTVAHRQGITADTHADAGIVSGPSGDFVLVAFLYRPEWLPWEESAPLISDLATAAYNYFSATE
jgi:hypothetical protein